MFGKKHVALKGLIFGMAAGGVCADDVGLLRTAYALDDARGYCIDIAGFGANARVDDPLQVHTCKYGAALGDQVFARSGESDRIEIRQYDRCLAAAGLEPGANLFVKECNDSGLQQWRFEWGRLSPVSRPDLCVALADGDGEIAGTPVLITPVYRRRDVSLAECSDAAAALQTLRFSPTDERALSTADVARLGLPDETQAELAAFGREFDGQIAGATAGIVNQLPRNYGAAEIEVIENVAYGSHERQVFDIRKPTVRNAADSVPVIVIFHGGGLVGGSKGATASQADYFASLGFIGVNSNYRLAPDHPWPDGPRDVGAAVTWLHDNIAEHGGNPDQIFVIGISSGSLHSATYALRSELMTPGTVRAAGAILMSGPYTFDFTNVAPNQIAYYGDDPAQYSEKVVVGNVTSTDIPLMFTTAEWDAPRYTRAFSELLREIVIEHGIMPRYHQSLGHNHSSQIMTLGTAESAVATEIIDFIQQTINAD